MKKVSHVILILVASAVFLVSCGNLAAKKAESLIDSIGEVTLESKDAILQAKDAIDKLTEEEKGKVSNLRTLEEACERLDYLELDEKAKPVEEKIAEIGQVDEDDEDLIAEAKKMFSNLPEVVQALVDNADELSAAEIRILALPIEKEISEIGSPIPDEYKYKNAQRSYDEASDDVRNAVTNSDALVQAKLFLDVKEAQRVIDKIYAIPALNKITVDDKTQILMARVAYDTLSEDCKQYVDNLDILEQAEEKLEEITRQKVAETLENLSGVFTKTYDEEQEVTWYISKAQPKYINERTYILPYIGRFDEGNYSSLRLIVSYTGDKYINFDEIKVMTDGVGHYREFEEAKIKRNSDYGDFCETADVLTTYDDEEILRDIANADKAVVTFMGENENIDITISESDKQAIREVLDYYDALVSSYSSERTIDVDYMKNALDIIS